MEILLISTKNIALSLIFLGSSMLIALCRSLYLGYNVILNKKIPPLIY